MITTGYWCDECRMKYVRHKCHGRRLPCLHDFRAAIPVWCQDFARGGEHVCIVEEDVWIYKLPRRRGTFYSGNAFFYWNMEVVRETTTGDSILVGEWLAVRSDKFVRAFLNRWQSCNETPDWIGFRCHPLAKRAAAMMVRPCL